MKKLAKKSQLAVERTSLVRGNRKGKRNLRISDLYAVVEQQFAKFNKEDKDANYCAVFRETT